MKLLPPCAVNAAWRVEIVIPTRGEGCLAVGKSLSQRMANAVPARTERHPGVRECCLGKAVIFPEHSECHTSALTVSGLFSNV